MHAAASTLAPGSVPCVVLDTNVCLDLFLFHDAACAGLAAALDAGRARAVTRADCRDEWLRVLNYPALPIGEAQRPGLAAAYAACHQLLPAGAAGAAPHPALPRCADPDDQKFLELAAASGARWLLSKDNELLRLDRRMRAATGCAVLRPADFRWPAAGA